MSEYQNKLGALFSLAASVLLRSPDSTRLFHIFRYSFKPQGHQIASFGLATSFALLYNLASYLRLQKFSFAGRVREHEYKRPIRA